MKIYMNLHDRVLNFQIPKSYLKLEVPFLYNQIKNPGKSIELSKNIEQKKYVKIQSTQNV